MADPPVILITFAGRPDRMALLQHHVREAMRRGLIHEWHVWDCARSQEDAAWLLSQFPALRRTPDDLAYRLVPAARLAAHDHVLRFAVRAGHDAHLALLGEHGGPSYEFVFGGWGNSAVGLRVWPAGMLPDHAQPPSLGRTICPTPALLSANHWRAVELRVDQLAGQLEFDIRVDGRDVARFVVAAPGRHAGFHVAAMSGYGASAEWRFAADADQPAGLYFARSDPRFHGWNPIYHHYAARAADYADAVFVKCDDDIVYFDIDRLADFIAFRRAQPHWFLVSASVLNNGVCAAAQQQLGLVPRSLMQLELPAGGFRGSLWESGAKAEALHRWFLQDPTRLSAPPCEVFVPPDRFSINMVAWRGADLACFDTRFTDDEADLTTTLPRYWGRRNAIYLPFVAAHLSFRPQDAAMDVPGLLQAYRALAHQVREPRPA